MTKLVFVLFALIPIMAVPSSLRRNSSRRTNSSSRTRPPGSPKVAPKKVIDQIERVMEWDIRKINVIWYNDESAFERVHGFGPSVLAFARRSDNTVHVGPRVNTANFDGVFGHELVHIIVYQKYKDAIPPWLDEGLANYAANRVNIDYAWLASQPIPDIHTLTHPFNATHSSGEVTVSARYHYMASTALMEMLASHCDIHDLPPIVGGGKSLRPMSPLFVKFLTSIKPFETGFN